MPSIPIRVVSETTLPPYRSPAALCGLCVRRGRCELIPATSLRATEWSATGFRKAGRPIPKWWQDDPVVPARAVELFRLANAYYFPATGSIVSADGEAMESATEEYRYCAPGHVLLPHPCMSGNGDTINFDPPAQLPRLKRAIVTMPFGAITNYGHFVLDCLSGLVATMGVRKLRGYPYVFPRLAPWQVRHLELVGVTSPVITEQPAYRISRLFFTNTMAHNLHSPNVHFLTLRDLQLSNVRAGVLSDVGERIYLSRRGIRQRCFVNEPKIETRLESLGFSIVQPELYEVDQQIAMFNRAKVVVGAAGAAFANVLYCRPGTLVVEIVPTPMAAPWTGWLCALTGSRWRPYYCEGRSARTWAAQIDMHFSAEKDELISHILSEIAE